MTVDDNYLIRIIAMNALSFADGEPNNKQEKCVNIYTSTERLGKWNDNICDLTHTSKVLVAVCQKELLCVVNISIS